MSQHDFYYEFSGTSREIGLAHGRTLRPLIQKTVKQWQDFLAEQLKTPFEILLKGFIEKTNYLPAIKKFAPHLLEEMRGIAEGAEMDEKVIYAWQMVDEFIDYLIESIYVEKCSTLGAYDQAGGCAPIIGKTQDLMHCYIGSSVLLRIRNTETGADVFCTTAAGIISQDGMGQGVAMCLNHVGHLDRDLNGLPVTFLGRLILERAGNIDEAVALLNELPHASGMNYGLADRNASRSFEASASAVIEFAPLPDLKRHWHTNHPVANDNYCRHIDMWTKLPDVEAGNTQKRFDFLEREISKNDQPMVMSRVQELLSSREAPVSSHADDSFPTVYSVIMEMTEEPTLFFTPGPPSQHDYVTFTFQGYE